MTDIFSTIRRQAPTPVSARQVTVSKEKTAKTPTRDGGPVSIPTRAPALKKGEKGGGGVVIWKKDQADQQLDAPTGVSALRRHCRRLLHTACGTISCTICGASSTHLLSRCPWAAGLSFNIPGHPQGKGRARSTRSGHHYTPAKTRAYEDEIARCAREAMVGYHPITGPARVYLEAVYAVPASWPRAKKADALAGRIRPVVKPDLSNVLKAVEDSLNGIAWADDSQVVDVRMRKRYGSTPGVTVEVHPIPA